MTPTHATAAPAAVPHSRFEDAQGIGVGCLFVAFALVMLRESELVTGGTAGMAVLVHYRTDWPLGVLLFAVNLPFYVFGWRALGSAFTLKTFAAVTLLAAYVAVLPSLVQFERLDPAFAAVLAGLLAGAGILMLIRHGASLGGIGIMALYLQKTRRWRAGTIQMVVDALILLTAFGLVPPSRVLLSLLGAAAVNLVIGVNHRTDRYFGG